LLSKTATTVFWLLTNQRALLELRTEIDIPLAWVGNQAVEPCAGLPAVLRVPCSDDRYVYCHDGFSADIQSIQSRLGCCRFDLLEPFERIVCAIQESQRLGTLKDTGAKA
jgi:hypothetical protein